MCHQTPKQCVWPHQMPFVIIVLPATAQADLPPSSIQQQQQVTFWEAEWHHTSASPPAGSIEHHPIRGVDPQGHWNVRSVERQVNNFKGEFLLLAKKHICCEETFSCHNPFLYVTQTQLVNFNNELVWREAVCNYTISYETNFSLTVIFRANQWTVNNGNLHRRGRGFIAFVTVGGATEVSRPKLLMWQLSVTWVTCVTTPNCWWLPVFPLPSKRDCCCDCCCRCTVCVCEWLFTLHAMLTLYDFTGFCSPSPDWSEAALTPNTMKTPVRLPATQK